MQGVGRVEGERVVWVENTGEDMRIWQVGKLQCGSTRDY